MKKVNIAILGISLLLNTKNIFAESGEDRDYREALRQVELNNIKNKNLIQEYAKDNNITIIEATKIYNTKVKEHYEKNSNEIKEMIKQSNKN